MVVVQPSMTTSIPLSQLAAVLGCGFHEHVALVGGGGKTTLLHALGTQLVGRTVLTTTTKMGADQARGRPVLIAPTDAEIDEVVAGDPPLVFGRLDGHKAIGVDPAACDRWFGRVDHVVVEADGARRRPFKAPRPFEPVIPSTATLVVSVIGADALGRVIADQCHRPLRVAALAGCSPYVRLSPEAAAVVLLHERGALGAAPKQARLAVVITKVAEENRLFVEQLVAQLAERTSSLNVAAIDHF